MDTSATTTYSEDDLLPLSGLQHMAFCERRWALVQIERVWEDNRFTAEGAALHERAHSGEMETRPGVLIRRTMPIHCFRLGLSGQADIVEFQPMSKDEGGVKLEGRRGLWRPFPVEYKRSRDKAGNMAYRIQLCAQALCLEEMFSTEISDGAIYDGSTRRRQAVVFDGPLRGMVEELARRMHELFESGKTPAAVLKKACSSCSLVERCQPKTMSRVMPVAVYLQRAMVE